MDVPGCGFSRGAALEQVMPEPACTIISVVQPTVKPSLVLGSPSTKMAGSLRLPAWGALPDLVMPRSPSTVLGEVHLQLSRKSSEPKDQRSCTSYFCLIEPRDVTAAAAHAQGLRKLSINHDGVERGQRPTRVSDGSTKRRNSK